MSNPVVVDADAHAPQMSLHDAASTEDQVNTQLESPSAMLTDTGLAYFSHQQASLTAFVLASKLDGAHASPVLITICSRRRPSLAPLSVPEGQNPHVRSHSPA